MNITEASFPPIEPQYTANQPLMLGGQIYMWNRYYKAKNLVHMMEAQFSKFGHQSRIELCNTKGQKQMFIAPLEIRSFRPLNDVYLNNPEYTYDAFVKTINTLYGKKHVKDPDFVQGLFTAFHTNMFRSLARLNVAVTDYIWNYLFSDFKTPEGNPLYRTYISTEILPVRLKSPSEWVAEMGYAINCKTYIGGHVAAAAYLKEEHFTKRGMYFYGQDYTMPEYPLNNTATNPAMNSDAYVSIIDPILRLGKEATLNLIAA